MLQLKSLRLRNFAGLGVDGDFEYEYLNGVTVHVGQNGAGKTRFGEHAQYFAITGETAPGKTKERLLTWGAKTGYTELTFVFDGLEYVLTRNLHNSTVQAVSTDGAVKISGSKEVKAFMQKALNMSFSVFYETCFGRQKTMTRICEFSSLEMLQFFQKLLKLKNIEKSRGIIQAALARIPTYPDRTQATADLELQASTAARSEADGENSLSDLRESHATWLAAVEAQKVEWAGYPSAAEKAGKVNSLKQQLAADKTALQRITSQLREEKVVDMPSPTDVQRARDNEDARNCLANLEKWAKQIDSNNSKVPVLPEETEGLPADIAKQDSGLAKSRKILEGLLAEKNALEPQRKLAAQDCCPTCHQPLLNRPTPEEAAAVEEQYRVLTERISKGRTVIANAEAALRDAKAKLAAESTAAAVYTGSLRAWENNDTRLRAGYADEAAKLEALPLFDPDFDSIAVLQQAQDAAAASAANETAKKLRAQAAPLKQRLEETEAALAVAEQAVCRPADVDAAIASVAAETSKMQAEERRIGKLIAEAIASSSHAAKMLASYQDEKVKALAADKLRKMLQRSREILHVDELPKQVMSTFVSSLNTYLEFYLAVFDVKFTAKLTQDFSLVADFDGQTEVLSSDLSGGQQMVLSIAMIFSLSDLMSGQVSLLVLDEPTAWMDLPNRELLIGVLERVRLHAEAGTVVIVNTHDESIERAASRVITIG